MSRISSTPELFAIYKRYLADWMSAEEIIKRAELISQEVNYPAVQELRYAARRIVDAEYAADNGKKDEDIRWHLSEACRPCVVNETTYLNANGPDALVWFHL